ncbi:MAG: DUF4190 domain-containing protein [Thermoleophilaceae bacterium]|nr:DUF4190 domain-containing protein [Thermoleophilaceae bacterium]
MERPPDERSRHDAEERAGEPTPRGPQSPAPSGPQSPAPHARESDTPVTQPTAPAGSEQATERLPAPVPPPSPSPYGQYPHGQQYPQGPYQQEPYQQGHYQQPIYQPVYAPAPKPNGLAIASLVLGILWVYWIGSILALIFGMVGKSQIDNSGGAQSGRGMAIAGIVLGWVGIGILLLFILFFGGIAGCGALVSS